MIDLPELGLGCAPLAGLMAPVAAGDAAEVLHTALDRGIRFFDTAPFYGLGLSERRVGDALRGQTDVMRADVILCTKVGRLLRPGAAPDPAALGWPAALPFHPVYDYGYDAVMRSHADSLQRLGLDRVDMLLMHDIGAFTHTDPDAERRHFRDAMEGGYRALDELRREGRVRAIGIGVNEVEVAERVLDHGDWDVILLAGRYTLLEQTPLATLFPACARRGTRIVVGGPYNSGILVGGRHWNYAEAPVAVRARVAAIRAVCDGHGVPLPAAALRFCLVHPVVASVIPGVRSRAELSQTLDWLATPVPAALWDDLRAAGLIDPAAPTAQD